MEDEARGSTGRSEQLKPPPALPPPRSPELAAPRDFGCFDDERSEFLLLASNPF